MADLSQLTFGAPLVLAALAVLPVLYWLLRVTPPFAQTHSISAAAAAARPE